MDVAPRPIEAGAVIVAAGASTRMRGTDKIWAPLAGRPLIAWTVDAFERTPRIGEIALVVATNRLAQAQALRTRAGWKKVRAIVPGGARRRDSVLAGLEALDESCRWVAVHDGARPLVTPALIQQGLLAAARVGAAIASEPVKETIKRVAGNTVVETLPRQQLARAQTPQVFARARLLAAHHAVDPAIDPPDDALLASLAGIPMVSYSGSHNNLKVTTEEDLTIVESLLGQYG